jgi:WD40 repeat protein
MKKLLVWGAGGNSPFAARAFHIRQNLPLINSDEYVASPALQTSMYRTIAIAPNMNQIAITNGSTSGGANNVMIATGMTEDSAIPSYSNPPATFSGRVWCVAASNAFYAYGGTTPLLYVYDAATLALLPVPTTGLGTVYSISFSPDGARMAVGHTNGTKLRIYLTSDWSYVEADVTACGNTPRAIEWAPDSTTLAVGSDGGISPFFTIFTYAGVRTYASTVSARMNSIVGFKYTPDGSAIVMSGGAANFAERVTKFTISGSTFTPLAGISGNWLAKDLVLDADEGLAYMVHAARDGTTMSRFNYLTMDGLEDAGYDVRQSASNMADASLAILRRDTGRVTGTVRDIDNNPVSRDVYAFDRASKRLVAKTTSQAGTGNYTLRVPNTNAHDVNFEAASGEQLNDLFFARVEPEPV